MDIVQIFNDELQSLLDTKPPVSKAKMGLITRAAMKGVKFYKHIVLSVEKFISKCSPEYKVPGLYVIDSIVRQSRHQFGIERDVYAARFAKNLHTTFSHLFSGCSADDKPKMVRVLNLWQKNGVFTAQIIMPLLDLANPSSNRTMESNKLSATSPNANLDDRLSKHGQSSSYNNRNHFNSNSNPLNSAGRHQAGLKFSKNMLDFDYDEDDDDDGDETPTEAEPPLSSTLNKIEMEQRAQRNDSMTAGSPHQSSQSHGMSQQDQYHHQQHHHHHQQQQQQQQQPADPVLERWNRLIKQQSISSDNQGENPRQRSRSRSPVQAVVSQQQPRYQTTINRDTPQTTRDQVQIKDQSRSQSLSTSSRNPEREAERERKCLPKIRDKHLTVCSSTLWLGHVPKTVSEADISDAFGEYGSITSIDLIPPRGCAYVCMDRRQDAKKALTESRDLKLNGSHIKMAWAPGKGFKEYKSLKDFWEADTGSSFIPYSKVDESIDFDVLEEGGVIDEDSMSMEMRERRDRKAREKERATQGHNQVQPGLSLPLPALPILSQPPPPAIPPFAIPPPSNLNIPPPTALGQGAIPFPPPSVAASSSNHFQHPPPPLPLKVSDHQDNSDRNDIDRLNSPNSIEHQLSITERQINMVEQQLNMIQHSQNIGQHTPTSMPSLHPHAMFPPNHPNPMIFDLPPPPAHLLDPHHLAMFANPHLLNHPPPMLPISQANMMDPNNMNGNPMSHLQGRF